MTDMAESRSARPALSPAARALRLQRIFARLQEGASYQAIAAEEGVSRERLRQIVRAATARGKSPPDHKKMQFARLEPALRLAARGVAEGDTKAIPLLIKLLDRLDRYCEPDLFDNSSLLGDLLARSKRRRPRRAAPRASDGDADRRQAQTSVTHSEREPIENAENGNGQIL